ncbi:MAG: hypothetical protein IPO92_17015 [Saprospiraceae bacterium]|nr:hypothetical protein [Saprospiraceae bacterium]
MVDLSNAGTFCLGLTAINANYTCKDTICKEIFLDVTNPVITLVSDTITCLNDTVTIMLGVTRPLQFPPIWSSADGNPFIIDFNGIRVWKAGRYEVSVLADNNCSAFDTIIVFEDKSFVDPVIVLDTLTCALDSVQVMVFPDSTL